MQLVLMVQTMATIWVLPLLGNINKTPGLGLTQGGQDYDDKYGNLPEAIFGRDDQSIRIRVHRQRTLSRTAPCVTVSLSSSSTLVAWTLPTISLVLLSLDLVIPPVAEKTILMDDLLTSSAFVYELDEVLAHYSLRSEISAKIGHALAEAYDKKVFRIIAKSARTAHPITASPGPEPGGSVIKLGAGNEFNAQAIVDSFFEAASILDEKNVPSAVVVPQCCLPVSTTP